jgi:hypothetical protein
MKVGASRDERRVRLGKLRLMRRRPRLRAGPCEAHLVMADGN